MTEPVAPPPQTAAQTEMLANRLRKNARHLGKWARREGVTCYRLYDRDIPEIPLAIDLYEGKLHVAEFARPTSDALEDDVHDVWLDALVEAAADAMDVTLQDVYVKRRERQRGAAQYEKFGQEGVRHVVHEGGHRFIVNLSDYLDTGLFLDHRATRARVQAESAGKRVLNLFAYTGAFSVYAAAGGAKRTLSVDLSNTYAGWARENLALNGFGAPDHQVLREDVLQYIDDPQRNQDRWDIIVVDPPTFSNSKAMDEAFDVQRKHVELLNRLLSFVPRGGVVWFSTNFRRFKLDGGGIKATQLEDMTKATLPPDFRDARVHQTWRIVR